MYRIAICDDDKEQQNYIKKLLSCINDIEAQDVEIFNSGELLVEAYQKKQGFSMILLDMKMKDLDGIQTAKIVRKFDEKVLIIIITSIVEYAVEGYSIDALAFIVKPIDVTKFNRTIKKALNRLREDEKRLYRIQLKDITKFVKLSEIIYFESDSKKVKIHCVDTIVSNIETITEVENKLKIYGFIRISRFYLVNMIFIKEIGVGEVLLNNGKALRYSNKLQKQIKENYMNLMMGDM